MSRRKAAELRSYGEQTNVSEVVLHKVDDGLHTGCAEKRIKSLEKTEPQTMAAICLC